MRNNIAGYNNLIDLLERLGQGEMTRGLTKNPATGSTQDGMTLMGLARTLRFARDSDELNWELIRPKSPAWAHRKCREELGTRIAGASGWDREYLSDLPRVARECAGSTDLYDLRIGSDRTDSHSLLALCKDPDDDAPTWRMLPGPMSYEQIESLTAEILRAETEGESVRRVRAAADERRSALRLARHHSEDAPITFVAKTSEWALLLRYVNACEQPPQIEHVWESRIPIGRAR